MSHKPKNVVEASRQVTALANSRQVKLSGQTVKVSRLNWLQFEVLWAEIASSLSGVLVEGADQDPTSMVAELAAAPQLVIRLVGQTTGVSESELAKWPFDDVLQAAAVAVELNFTESDGVRSFFLAASVLLGPGILPGNTPDTRQPSTS